MSSLKIASWNINSVRARLGIVERFLTEEAPDILCLQETKVRDAEFPREMFERLGYRHLVLCGQPMHHGVAIASRLPIQEEARFDWQANGEARHLGVRLECGVRLENVYVPAGGDIPDRELNTKFGQKLDFVERMTRWSEDVKCPTIMVGDFNIAPLECDVWSHKQLLNVVSHTPIEVEALTGLQGSNDWVDLGRHFHPAPQRLHTWWSYRSPDWTRNDRGRRLDHMWATKDVAAQATRACRPRAVPGVGTAFRPCSPGHGVHALSGARDVARAIDALRRGWPVAIDDISFLAIETADADGLAAFDGGDAPAALLISGNRAATLKLTNQRAATAGGAGADPARALDRSRRRDRHRRSRARSRHAPRRARSRPRRSARRRPQRRRCASPGWRACSPLCSPAATARPRRRRARPTSSRSAAARICASSRARGCPIASPSRARSSPSAPTATRPSMSPC